MNAKRLTPVGSWVKLTRVAGRDNQDRYGRYLRYVSRSNVDMGGAQIKAGLADARYDSRDGYGWHPKQDSYLALDITNLDKYADAACATPATTTKKPAMVTSSGKYTGCRPTAQRHLTRREGSPLHQDRLPDQAAVALTGHATGLSTLVGPTIRSFGAYHGVTRSLPCMGPANARTVESAGGATSEARMSTPMGPEPGWYPDKSSSTPLMRYWDGRQWTSETKLPAPPEPRKQDERRRSRWGPIKWGAIATFALVATVIGVSLGRGQQLCSADTAGTLTFATKGETCISTSQTR